MLNNQGKKFLICNEDECLVKMKEMYPKAILTLSAGECGQCYICGKEDKWCNVFFSKTFSGIKNGFNGTVKRVKSEGYICSEECLQEFLKGENEKCKTLYFSKG